MNKTVTTTTTPDYLYPDYTPARHSRIDTTSSGNKTSATETITVDDHGGEEYTKIQQ